MADFVAVLRKTLDGLSETTPAVRERVYEKARSTIAGKLAAMNPPPPAGVIDRQKRALEDAIISIERDFAPQLKNLADPLSELESVFASLKNPDLRPLARPASVVNQPVREPTRYEPAAKIDAWPKTTPTQAPQPEQESDRGMESLPDADAEPDMFDDGEPIDGGTIADQQPERRRGYTGLVAALVVLAAIAGGGYGVWLNKDAFSSLLGLAGTQTTKSDPETKVATAPLKQAPAPVAAPPAKAPEPATKTAAPVEPPASATPPKFTQRLNSDGVEIDAGPAGGVGAIGEGTSVAEVTQPPVAQPPVATPPVAQPPAAAAGAPPADPAAPAATAQAPTDAPVPGLPTTGEPEVPLAATGATPAPTPPVEQPSVAVGQKAIFYEERTNVAQGSAEPGSIVWSLVQESPGGDLPPEPAIRAEATIPGKDVQLRMTIRRNADQTLPASHIIEVIFLTPQGFEGGGIDNVLRISLKSSEQEAGNPLIGIPAKIADGFFLIALNDTKPEMDANLNLLRRQSWIDVPVVYKSGRRALFTMEKGIPGEKVFDEALKAWQASSASAG